MTLTAVRIRLDTYLISGPVPTDVDAVYWTVDEGDIRVVRPGVGVLRTRHVARRRLPFDVPLDISASDIKPDRRYL